MKHIILILSLLTVINPLASAQDEKQIYGDLMIIKSSISGFDYWVFTLKSVSDYHRENLGKVKYDKAPTDLKLYLDSDSVLRATICSVLSAEDIRSLNQSIQLGVKVDKNGKARDIVIVSEKPGDNLLNIDKPKLEKLLVELKKNLTFNTSKWEGNYTITRHIRISADGLKNGTPLFIQDGKTRDFKF
jgi:hypothetical protein